MNLFYIKLLLDCLKKSNISFMDPSQLQIHIYLIELYNLMPQLYATNKILFNKSFFFKHDY